MPRIISSTLCHASARAPTRAAKPGKAAATLTRSFGPISRNGEANISLDASTGLKTLPGPNVKSDELERVAGKPIYSTDKKVVGKSEIDEVDVDALTGETIGNVQHEGTRRRTCHRSRNP